MTSGTVTYAKESIPFTLSGSLPDTSFDSTECGVVGGSSCYQLYTSLSAFTSDAGFIGGFAIPKPQ